MIFQGRSFSQVPPPLLGFLSRKTDDEDASEEDQPLSPFWEWILFGAEEQDDDDNNIINNNNNACLDSIENSMIEGLEMVEEGDGRQEIDGNDNNKETGINHEDDNNVPSLSKGEGGVSSSTRQKPMPAAAKSKRGFPWNLFSSRVGVYLGESELVQTDEKNVNTDDGDVGRVLNKEGSTRSLGSARNLVYIEDDNKLIDVKKEVSVCCDPNMEISKIGGLEEGAGGLVEIEGNDNYEEVDLSHGDTVVSLSTAGGEAATSSVLDTETATFKYRKGARSWKV